MLEPREWAIFRRAPTLNGKPPAALGRDNGPVAQGIEQQPSKLKVPGSNPGGVAKSGVSVPDTWVTDSSGHMGNTLGRVLSLLAAAKPLARYGAMGARLASGFAG